MEHLTEGTKEWNELAHYLLASGNNDPAFDAVARNYFKGDETVGESALAKFRAEGGKFADLNEQEQLFLTELIAHETEVLFGSERMLRRIAKEKRSLAKRLLERIEDFFRILKMSKEERKAFVKLEQARACLEKALLAAGETREDGKILQRSAIKLNDYEVFGIKSLNDYVGVQKAVLKKLLEEGFFSDGRNIIVNNDSGMEIEITKDGIKETLGKGKRFEELPRKLKELKISTIRTLPRLIETAQLVKDNSPNVHKNTSDLKYAYLSNEITVQTDNGNEDYIVTIAVRKSRQKNKFWIHEIRTTKSEQRLSSSGDVNPEQEYNKTVAHEQIVAQKSYSVKPDAKKSKADADFESFSAEDFFREAANKSAGRSVSEVVGESEKSANAPEAPLAPKKRGLSEGQAKKLEANYVNHKTFSRKEVAEVVDSITRKHLDFGEDYGVLIGKGRQEAAKRFFA